MSTEYMVKMSISRVVRDRQGNMVSQVLVKGAKPLIAFPTLERAEAGRRYIDDALLGTGALNQGLMEIYEGQTE